MPNKTKLDLKELNVQSFQTSKEMNLKIMGGYITARINTCNPCRPGGTNNPQCTMGCD